MAQWQEPETQVIWLAVEFAVLLVVMSAMVLFTRKYIRNKIEAAQHLADLEVKHQKEMLVDSIRVQEKERERIANDLHDDLITQLTIMVTRMHTENNVDRLGPMMQQSIQTARRISHDLHPPLIECNHWLELMEEVLHQLDGVYHLDYQAREEVTLSLSNSHKLQLIRILQEAVNNIIKHAEATTIRFQVRSTRKYLMMVLADNGIGFDTSMPSSGLGRRNLEMRTEMLNGSYRVHSKPGSGTTYLFVFPITPDML
ncbi:hypothetical protein KFE98_16015 [bacterium SCSIO 12741]|nr:hypothetical protein KFE98_16015 [bacterium SCSIO 12741]